MDQLIRGIVKSDQPVPLKGAFLDKISTAATYGNDARKEYKTIINTCLEILYPADENRCDADECFVNDRVEGVLTTWVQHHMGANLTKKALKIGDVVVMKTLPPNSWRLGRVEALVGPGKKVVRGATLVTRSNGALVTRPLQEIIPLGLCLSEISERSSEPTSVDFKISGEGSLCLSSTELSAKSSTEPFVEPTTTSASVESTSEFSTEPDVTSSAGDSCANTSDEPTTEPNVVPVVEPTTEVDAEPTVESTNRRGRKRRGSAVTGEVKRRYTRRK